MFSVVEMFTAVRSCKYNGDNCGFKKQEDFIQI